LKINIPLSNDGDFLIYNSVKNQSFYFGTLLKEVFKETNYMKLYNRRAYDICYFKDLKELKKVTDFLKINNNELRYAVNHSYPKRFKEKIKKELELVLNNIDLDYVILEDLDLVDIVEKYNKKVFISTRLAPLNKEEAKFFHKLLGKTLGGFVMPRQATVEEINEINEFCINKGLKLEIFFELGGCLNEERFCFFHELLDFKKNLENKPIDYPICFNIFKNSPLFKGKLKFYGSFKDHFTCRACILWDIKYKENIYLKIVGRCFKNQRNYKIYKFAKQIIENLNSKDFNQFLFKNRMSLLKNFGKLCNPDCPTLSFINKN
jgi:hypothetical protein